jgi:hypothetical protein
MLALPTKYFSIKERLKLQCSKNAMNNLAIKFFYHRHHEMKDWRVKIIFSLKPEKMLLQKSVETWLNRCFHAYFTLFYLAKKIFKKKFTIQSPNLVRWENWYCCLFNFSEAITAMNMKNGDEKLKNRRGNLYIIFLI